MKLIMLSLGLGFAQIGISQITFDQVYGEGLTAFGFNVEQTMDGGYAVFGSSWSNGGADMYLLKTDAYGVEQWNRNYGSVNPDLGYGAHQTLDGGYILCGTSNALGNDSLILVRTDGDGTALWTRTYPGSLGRDIGFSVLQTSDGGFAVCGFTQGAGIAEDIYLVRTDPNGDTLWTSSIDLGNSEVGWSVRQTSDGGFIVLANSYSFADPDGDIYLLRYDSYGDTLWTRTIISPGPDETHGFAICSDGGYIIAGGNGYPNRDLLLIRTDAQGMEQWRQTPASSGDQMANQIQEMDDGGFVVCGRTALPPPSVTYMYLLRTDDNGTMLWEREFGRGIFSEAISLDRTSDGGFVIAGSTTDTIAGFAYTDMYLVKTNGDGVVSIAPSETLDPLVKCYPNPATDRLRIDSGTATILSIKLLDAMGQCVLDVRTSNVSHYALGVENLANGPYVLAATISDGRTYTQRVLVAR